MYLNIYLLLIILSVSVGYAGEKELYLFGGGGGPDGDDTIYDEEIGLLSNFVNSKKRNWKSSYTFNGGHQKTEKILQNKFKNSTSFGSFSKKNLLLTLDNIEEKIKKLKKGDQLLLVMNTHGLNNSSNEKSHSIVTSPVPGESYKTTEGARIASMDEFERIIALADEKGIKLAVVDLSCYSGNTLKLKKKNICIISTTGENQLGYADVLGTPPKKLLSFEGRFLNGMKQGENLENLFLKSRKESHFQDFPMISTETGTLVNDLMFKLLEPYLVYNDENKYDFSKSYDSKNIPEALCKTQNEYSEINKRLKEITELYSIPISFMGTAKLEQALKAYRAYQLEFEKAYTDSQMAGNEVKEIIRRDYPDQANLFDDEEGNAIMSLVANREKSMRILKDIIDNDKTSLFTSVYQKSYDSLSQKNKICLAISSKISASSLNSMNNFAKTFVHSNKTQLLVENVASAAKLFYDKLYLLQSAKSMENNPCKDFVL